MAHYYENLLKDVNRRTLSPDRQVAEVYTTRMQSDNGSWIDDSPAFAPSTFRKIPLKLAGENLNISLS
jgi:hypothetical protein